MEIKEAIRIVKYDRVSRALSKNTYDAIGKLITIAEQVERVKGIEDKPIIDNWAECDANTDAVYSNKQNSQWRALIVGVLTKPELREFIWERCEMDDRKTEEILSKLHNLFLGEIK